jgi:hypothetical protein
VIGRCVRSATQQWPKRVDGRLDRSVESEDQAARVGAESEGAAARLVGPELGDVDQLRQAIHSANRASRGSSEVHFRRMRRRRRWGSLTNRDAGLLCRLDGCPDGASFGHRGAHDGQHRVDEVVEVEPVTATPPGAHDETQPRVLEPRLPNSAHEFPPGSLTSR